jgi:methyltransferase
MPETSAVGGPQLWSLALLLFVTVQRGGELVWGRSNERRLRAMGAIEVGAAHYPLIVALHAGWLIWLWLRGWERPLIWPWVAMFFALQLARAWVLSTLGRRWTTRVFFLPGETLVQRGPFRLIPHPNYAVVAMEMAVLPLGFGLVGAALVFGLANLAVLAWRIRVEERALQPLRASGAGAAGG